MRDINIKNMTAATFDQHYAIGQRTPGETQMNDPSENTAELSVAKELSLIGTTVPRYFFTSSGRRLA
jgi:hypothetical protein